MVSIDLPWRGDSEGEDGDEGPHPDAIVACEFQDGTLAVFEDEVVIERVPRSKFLDKTIPLSEVTGVEYEGGITVGFLQVTQRGVETDSEGFLSDPIDENTLHFSRGGRACAKEARDAILERAGG
ncbi:hypothetical protein BRC92_09220 [Halobacteriales archaeon QS_4_69_31]|jgi:hypothetical protein|nr:MAG: hypothetical protein BRC92_09220 [Halobacteriales archaeon QS_4_69_31]